MIEFLDAIWPEDLALLGELRFIDRDGVVMQKWLPLGSGRAAYATDIANSYGKSGRDTYFGVLPRTRAAGTAEAAVDTTTLLWADVDAKHHDPDNLERGKMTALQAISSFPITPSILVDSGGGYHAYWLLYVPADVEMFARPVMKGIAHLVGGDAVHDPARVLRLPGSVNYKREKLVEARVLRFDARRKYRPEDFIPYIAGKQHPYRLAGVGPNDAAFERRDLPEWLVELINCGAPKGQRSEASFKAVIWLIRFGRSFNEILDLFEGSPNGIGAKYSERGWDWLKRTFDKAMEEA